MQKISILISIAALGLSAASAENWPQFRGLGGQGIVANPEKIPTEWSESKNLVWKSALPGKGSSSPIIWEDRIFLTSYTGYGQSEEAPGEMTDLERHLICLNKADGKILWQKSNKSTHNVLGYSGFLLHHGYASCTPVTDGKTVYVFYAKEGAFAYDFDGNELWHFDGVDDRNSGFGSAGALTLHEDLLLVNASTESSAYIALNKNTGEEVWRAEGIVQSYNTPTVFGDVVIAHSRDQMLGLDIQTGEQKWKGFGPPAYVCNSPTIVDGIAYVTHGYPGPTAAIGPDGAEIWRRNKLATTVPSPAVVNELVFIAKGDVFTCLDAKTGEDVFRNRMGVTIKKDIYASPLVVGDRLMIVTRIDGTLVFAADKSGDLLSHNIIAGDDSWFNATPAASEGRLYLRSETTLYCIGQ